MQQYDVSEVDELQKVYIQLKPEGAVFSNVKIKTPEDAVCAVANNIRDMDREMLYAINLRADNTPINVIVAAIGDESGSLCSPAALIRAAILSNATSMMLIHNHPSGDLRPSASDIKFADKMIQICRLHEMDFLDSIVIAYGKQQYYSMREKERCNFYRDSNEYTEDVEKLSFSRKGIRMV